MNIYHRQRVFKEQHQRWANNLAELKIEADNVLLKLTPNGFIATTTLDVDGATQKWHVQQDSRLWRSEYQEQVEQALVSAGKNANQLQLALESVTSRQREGLEFLIAHMPQPDLEQLSAEFLIENVREAYETLDDCSLARCHSSRRILQQRIALRQY